MRGIRSRRKRYVEVVAHCFEDGRLVPLSVAWDDGRVFGIDRILDVRRAASLKVGGVGTRFIVCIGHRTTNLFFEDPRWFVEEIVPEGAPVALDGSWDEREMGAWEERRSAGAASKELLRGGGRSGRMGLTRKDPA
ncbi:MAG: hypothetical protein ACLSVD_04140 [Eggerthellaceae bacterium]